MGGLPEKESVTLALLLQNLAQTASGRSQSDQSYRATQDTKPWCRQQTATRTCHSCLVGSSCSMQCPWKTKNCLAPILQGDVDHPEIICSAFFFAPAGNDEKNAAVARSPAVICRSMTQSWASTKADLRVMLMPAARGSFSFAGCW